MKQLSISPYVQSILDRQQFELVEVIRYGPRYASLIVKRNGQTGFFKCALPREEQEQYREANYFWTEHDSQYELDRRILREAKLLQYLSLADERDFEPRILDYSDIEPIWSLRTYVENNSFAQENSTFAFAEHFFDDVQPEQVYQLIRNIQSLSASVPETVSSLIDLADKRKIDYAPHLQDALAYAKDDRLFSADEQSAIETILSEAWHFYNQHAYVLTHGEAYPPHFIRNDDGVLGLIDWENAAFDDELYDFSVLYLRTYSNPDWQRRFYDLIKAGNYFADTGAKRWQAELVTQSILNHRYISGGGSFGSDDYNVAAKSYFIAEIKRLIA